MQLIASDGGLLAAPSEVRSLTLAPGERAQVIVDLSEGRPLRLIASSPANAMGMMGGQGGGMMGGGMMGNRADRERQGRTFSILDMRPSGASTPVMLPPTLAALAAPDPHSPFAAAVSCSIWA